MKTFKVTLQGCDDCTYIPMKLSKEEVEIIKRLSDKSTKISSYGCMPILTIEEVSDKDYWTMVSEEGF